MTIPYQPLRIPPGWLIHWNTLLEVDPTKENIAADRFGGSSLFLARNDTTRLLIDVAWQPEDDPEGKYVLQVYYSPWERTESGRRSKEQLPPDFCNSRKVYEFSTVLRAELVVELESALRGRSEWVEHS